MQTEKNITVRGVNIPLRELKTMFFLDIPYDFTGTLNIKLENGEIISQKKIRDDMFTCTMREFLTVAKQCGYSVTPIIHEGGRDD